MMRYCFAILLSLLTVNSFGQSEFENFPEIGKKLPEFALTHVENFNKAVINSTDLRDRFYLLDFFGLGCTSCFASFPKLNELQKKFDKDLQMVLIGSDYGNIRDVYNKYKVKLNLVFPVSYETTVFEHLVPFGGVPHVIWVDKNGIVKAITSSNDVTEENIKAFIAGNNFAYTDYSYKERKKLQSVFDPTKPFLINGNGGSDTEFIFRSTIAKWNPSVPQYSLSGFSDVLEDVTEIINGKIGYQVLGEELPALYKLAFTGKRGWTPSDPLYTTFYSKLLLETKNTAIFNPDYSKGENVYSISLIVPKEKATTGFLMKFLQRELCNYFGFEAAVESRVLPCWKIIASKEAKARLATKGGKPNYTGSAAGFTLTNLPSNRLANLLWSMHQLDLPFVDATGIAGNIDITINAMLDSMEDIKKEYNKNGLDIVKGEKEYKVIVIRDAIKKE